MPSKPLRQHLIEHATRIHARSVFSRFMRDTRRATTVQDRLLKSLLRANAQSAYGREHGFNTIRNYNDFTKQVPISRYADLAPWIDRVKSGETSAMFAGKQRVHMFAMTSGTVDQPKYIPVTDQFLRDQRAGWSAFGVKALIDHRGEEFMRPLVQVASPMDEQRTDAGIPCGAITGLMAQMQRNIVRKYYVVPPQVAYISDTSSRRYTIMRLAMPVDIGWIVTASPATVLQLARTGNDRAESLIRDIHDGALSADIEVPDDVRRTLAPGLTPDAACAKRLQELFDTHGALRPGDYWNLSFLANWTGGTMGLYLQDYPEWFGETPVRDIGLLATEGRMSIPIADGTPAGVAAVSTVFFEFVPAAEYESDEPVALRSHEVTPGQDYFILLTTSAGFYRYDISDCVRVVGFEGQAPLIEFLHKGAHVSSMTGEKISERQVVLAFERACAAGGARHRPFVLAPAWDDPPHYRLYVEGAPRETARDAAEFDAQLRAVNVEYDSKRASGRLGPVAGCAVQFGAIGEIDESNAGRFRRANEQFKHQYLLTKLGADDALAARAVATDRKTQATTSA